MTAAGKMEQRDGNRLCRSLAKRLADVGVTESLVDQNTAYRRRPAAATTYGGGLPPLPLVPGGKPSFLFFTDVLTRRLSLQEENGSTNIGATKNSPSFVCFPPTFLSFFFLLF